jgi:hypothetical protein
MQYSGWGRLYLFATRDCRAMFLYPVGGERRLSHCCVSKAQQLDVMFGDDSLRRAHIFHFHPPWVRSDLGGRPDDDQHLCVTTFDMDMRPVPPLVAGIDPDFKPSESTLRQNDNNPFCFGLQ